MTYQYAVVIYGIPIDGKLSKKFTKLSPGDMGFEEFYSSGGDEFNGYCGVKLDSFDSFGVQFVSELILNPTPEQKKEAEDKCSKLDKKLIKNAKPIGVYIVWGSS